MTPTASGIHHALYTAERTGRALDSAAKDTSQGWEDRFATAERDHRNAMGELHGALARIGLDATRLGKVLG